MKTRLIPEIVEIEINNQSSEILVFHACWISASFPTLIKASPIDFEANEFPNTRGHSFDFFYFLWRSTPPITPEVPAHFGVIIIRGVLLGTGTLHGSLVSRNHDSLAILLGMIGEIDRSIQFESIEIIL